MQRLPQPFDMIHPRRVNWLIIHPELRVCFQPAQRFTAFVDDVLFDNERSLPAGMSPSDVLTV